ncbi:MAG: ubiquinol-cytochrome c reductase iron-sulfur subunit [Phycisphaerae bacterium]|nr:ubiquinol-cytochrome c reductase iron-sulfur subunit [Phycisphaerae bacterium]
MARRTVLTAAGVGWTALTLGGTVGVLGVPRLLAPNVTAEPEVLVDIGELAGYAQVSLGTVDERFKRQGFWVVRLPEGLVALSTSCTHLGCLLNWDDRDGRFKCPCHGSGFDLAGVNREGPAPRPLERLRVTVEDGRVIVDGRRRFRGERGEWGHSESMVRLEPSAES